MCHSVFAVTLGLGSWGDDLYAGYTFASRWCEDYSERRATDYRRHLLGWTQAKGVAWKGRSVQRL